MSENNSEKSALVPRLRFPEFREAGEWQEKELAKFLTESRIEGSSGDIAKKITIKLWGKGVFAKQESIKGSENTKYYKRRAGQFIYSKLDFLNQAFGIVPEELDGFESTVDLPCFDIGEELDSVFLLEYVKREDFYKKNGEIADGGRKAKRIQTEVFLSFPIAQPAQKTEQQKIADCLSSLDELITAETQKLDALKTHKKSLMQQLFPCQGETVPRLRFPDFRKEGEWEEKSIGKKLDMMSGFPFDGTDIGEDVSGIPLMRGINITEGYIRHNQDIDRFFSRSFSELEKYRLRENDLVIGMDGSKIGKNSALVTEADAGALLVQRVARLRSGCETTIRFVFQHINSIVFHAYVDRINTSGGIPHISLKQISDFEIFFPGIGEQQQIADFLSSLDDLITAQSKKIDALKTHKKGLMQQLFPVIDEAQA